MNYKILMVDDDRELLKMLSRYFTLMKYTVIIAENGIEALEKINTNPDIILLDVNMPGMDGIEVCRRIRDTVSCPIIFLTAKVEEQDRVMGLLSGGDDYVVKPFSLKELDARIIAHLKREERLHRKTVQRFYGDLVIDYARKNVQIKGQTLDFTKLEYDIMEFLSMNPEIVFDKERIYEKISGYEAEGESRVVTELIRRIRKKIKMYTQHEYIETVWGMGYKWIK
ncbi:MAG: response regulator transcription factor [Lachnospiraceae bacterium]|nr:response regulator transcription factor [Lachnospiraceae bacterium]